DWPVTRESCFPDPDPTLELVRWLAARAGPRLAPPSDALRRLDPDDYLAIALSWCEEDGVELTPPYLDVLASVCHIHAALQAERAGRDIEAALADSRFRVFDLRGASDRTGIGALATDVGTAVRLLLIDGETAPAWLERLVRAVLDDRDRIEFAEGSVDRPPGS